MYGNSLHPGLVKRTVVVWCLAIAAVGLNARPNSNSTLSLQVRDGRPVVEGVYLNGSGPYRFLLDTGARTNQIEAGIARLLRLRPMYRVEMVTSAGTVLVDAAKNLAVTVGPVTATDQEFLFTSLDAVHRWSPNVQGVLGQEFLEKFDYLLDFGNARIVFGSARVQGVQAQVEVLDGRPAVFTNLGRLILDSGTNRLILFGSPSGIIGTPKILQTSSGVGTAYAVFGKKLMIEGQAYEHSGAFSIPRPGNLPEDGLLPASLFKAVYVNNSEKLVVLVTERTPEL